MTHWSLFGRAACNSRKGDLSTSIEEIDCPACKKAASHTHKCLSKKNPSRSPQTKST